MELPSCMYTVTTCCESSASWTQDTSWSESLQDDADWQDTVDWQDDTLKGMKAEDGAWQDETRSWRGKRRSGKRSAAASYKHVPHSEKPPLIVERRNARERRRVQAVNTAFVRLRRAVPIDNRGKRVSKVKTLQKAIEYIGQLQNLLHQEQNCNTDLNKENQGGHTSNRWEVGGCQGLVDLLTHFDEENF